MAVTLTASELADALDGTDATRLLVVVTELVVHYAPDAPDAMHNEAAIRAAGWLAERPAAASGETVGPLSASYAPGQHSALRHSGAMALLSPYKVRRAGVI